MNTKYWREYLVPRESGSEKDSLYRSPNIFRVKIKMGRSCGQNGKRWDAFKFLTGKPTGKRPLGRSMSRWEDNIIISL